MHKSEQIQVNPGAGQVKSPQSEDSSPTPRGEHPRLCPGKNSSAHQTQTQKEGLLEKEYTPQTDTWSPLKDRERENPEYSRNSVLYLISFPGVGMQCQRHREVVASILSRNLPVGSLQSGFMLISQVPQVQQYITGSGYNLV